MGKVFKLYLTGSRVWSCSGCGAHLAYHEHIVSKHFRGHHGKAYLFSNVVNVGLGAEEERTLMTGAHTVADVFCNVCNSLLGWKYIKAYDEGQQYKEGKFTLEKEKMAKDKQWV